MKGLNVKENGYLVIDELWFVCMVFCVVLPWTGHFKKGDHSAMSNDQCKAV